MNQHLKAKIGIFLFGTIVLFFILGILFCPYSPSGTSLADKNCAPSFAHWFGTDELGRDLLARTLQGMRISLTIGACAAAIDLFIGTLWGTIAGFAGPRLEYVMMRISELIYSLPYLLVVILVSVFIGTGFLPLIVAMICIGWIQMARVVRVLVKDARHAEYVLAAWTLGARPSRLFFMHIFPNIVGPMAAACMLSIPHAIFTESFLSFLGIGIQPPTASLGSMVGDAIPAMRFYPWRLLFPAGCISILIFSIMLLTDSLRDLYDPKQRLGDKAI